MLQPIHRKNLLSAALAATLLAAPVTAPQSYATEMSHGEMAAAIRSANYPCAHVISLENTGENSWSVKCNSGKFDVSQGEDGSFTVTQTE